MNNFNQLNCALKSFDIYSYADVLCINDSDFLFSFFK